MTSPVDDLIAHLESLRTFEGDVRADELMAPHTTYRIGGPAAAFVRVDSFAALREATNACIDAGVSWTVVGKGSNLLVADDGYDGIVIELGRDFRTWSFAPDTLRFTVGAGVSLARIVQEAFHRGLSGMEFAVGTPGTLGGALRMNAGSADEWLGSHVVSVTSFAPGHGRRFRQGSDIVWRYRSSSLPADEVVMRCVLQMERGDADVIRRRMDARLARRTGGQPGGFSCGSVFRNPEGKSAGALIEGVGLKGATFGGAVISEKHANFIINTGDATAADVKDLIERARREVKATYGIELQPEVRFLGFPL